MFLVYCIYHNIRHDRPMYDNIQYIDNCIRYMQYDIEVKKQSVSMDDTLGMPGKSAIKALEKLSMFLRLDAPDAPDAHDYKRVYVSQFAPRIVPLSRLDVLEVFGKELTRRLLWDPIFEAYFSEKTRTFGEELVTAPERKIVAADKDATSSSEK